MSAMEWLGPPMAWHCADAWSALRGKSAARKNADKMYAARWMDAGKQEHRMKEIVSEVPIGGHSKKSGLGRTEGCAEMAGLSLL
jgi:hypothetical protein